MEAKDRVYQALCRMSKSDCQITAAALAEELNLSRQVVSHYLNRLLEEGCVEKTLTRPVCWNIRKQQRENVQGSVSEERKEIEEVLPEVRREDVFDAMIGADGSQKNVIENAFLRKRHRWNKAVESMFCFCLHLLCMNMLQSVLNWQV